MLTGFISHNHVFNLGTALNITIAEIVWVFFPDNQKNCSIGRVKCCGMQMWLSKLVSTAQTLVNVSFTETQDRDRLYLLVFIDDQKDIQQLCATDITVFSKMQPSQQLRNCQFTAIWFLFSWNDFEKFRWDHSGAGRYGLKVTLWIATLLKNEWIESRLGFESDLTRL